MPYLLTGLTRYPFVPGHEWAGTVIRTGTATTMPVGTRVTGDVFLPCRHCADCAVGRVNVCPDRFEIGVRGNWPGALADEIRLPQRILHVLPDRVTAEAAIFAEPGVTALHALERCSLLRGERCLILGGGTLALLAVQIAAAMGAIVDCATTSEAGRQRARSLGAAATSVPDAVERAAYDVTIEAAGRTDAPAQAVRSVRAGGRVGLIGVSAGAAHVDANDVVLNDISVHGVIGGPGRFPRLLQLIASGVIDTGSLVGRRISLTEVADVLAGPQMPDAPPKTIVTWAPGT